MNQALLMAVCDKMVAAAEQYFESGEYVKVFSSKELADCVVYHAAAAGAAAMAAGVLPGVGSVISAGIATGAVWRMYIKICQIIGSSFGENKLKAISSAVVTNLITQLAGMYAIQFAASFIPGAGIVIVGVGNFTVTYFAGIVFLNVLTEIFKVDRKDIDTDNIDETIKQSIASFDKKALLKEAGKVFKQMLKDGSLDKAGKTIDISEE